MYAGCKGSHSLYFSISCPHNHHVKTERSRPSPYPLCNVVFFHMCISCVTANIIAVGEWGMVLICDGKHSCQDECKNRYFCNVSQQVFSGVITCTSPKVIFPSLKKILISRICFQFFLKLSSQKNFTFVLGNLRTEFTCLIAKSTIPGLHLLHTTVFARCVRKPSEAVFESFNLRRLACLFLTTSLLDLLGRVLWNRYVDVKESFKST